MRDDWFDPGHSLPEPGTYRDLDAWVNSKGEVFVGNHAIRVLPADGNTERTLGESLDGHSGYISTSIFHESTLPKPSQDTQ